MTDLKGKSVTAAGLFQMNAGGKLNEVSSIKNDGTVHERLGFFVPEQIFLSGSIKASNRAFMTLIKHLQMICEAAVMPLLTAGV